jgi:hypothetical protein
MKMFAAVISLIVLDSFGINFTAKLIETVPVQQYLPTTLIKRAVKLQQ